MFVLGTKTTRKQSSSEDLGRFPFTNQNFPNFGNSGKWCRNFRKSFQKFRKLFKFRNASHDSTSKILEISGSKVQWQKNFREKLTLKTFKYTLRGCPIFQIFSKMLFHSPCWLLEIAENFNQTFRLNGKRSCTSDKTVFDSGIGQFTIWRLCHAIQLEQRLENADDRPITCMSILGCLLERISVFVLKTSVAYYLFANIWFSLRQGKYIKWPFLITKVGSTSNSKCATLNAFESRPKLVKS